MFCILEVGYWGKIEKRVREYSSHMKELSVPSVISVFVEANNNNVNEMTSPDQCQVIVMFSFMYDFLKHISECGHEIHLTLSNMPISGQFMTTLMKHLSHVTSFRISNCILLPQYDHHNGMFVLVDDNQSPWRKEIAVDFFKTLLAHDKALPCRSLELESVRTSIRTDSEQNEHISELFVLRVLSAACEASTTLAKLHTFILANFWYRVGEPLHAQSDEIEKILSKMDTSELQVLRLSSQELTDLFLQSVFNNMKVKFPALSELDVSYNTFRDIIAFNANLAKCTSLRVLKMNYSDHLNVSSILNFMDVVLTHTITLKVIQISGAHIPMQLRREFAHKVCQYTHKTRFALLSMCAPREIRTLKWNSALRKLPRELVHMTGSFLSFD